MSAMPKKLCRVCVCFNFSTILLTPDITGRHLCGVVYLFQSVFTEETTVCQFHLILPTNLHAGDHYHF
jgi:hypothetical protein